MRVRVRVRVRVRACVRAYVRVCGCLCVCGVVSEEIQSIILWCLLMPVIICLVISALSYLAEFFMVIIRVKRTLCEKPEHQNEQVSNVSLENIIISNSILSTSRIQS